MKKMFFKLKIYLFIYLLHICILNYECIERYSSTNISHYSEILIIPSKRSLIVGARDYLLQFNLDKLTKENLLTDTNNENSLNDNNIVHKELIQYWPASADAIEECLLKGQTENLCHNYVKILHYKQITNHNKTSEYTNDENYNEILVCGTNAFKPKCATFKINNFGKFDKISDGLNKCPLSPLWKTTSLLLNSGDYYYGGGLNFMGTDLAIIKQNVTLQYRRTVRVDSKWLNIDTNFVFSYEDGDYVYFLFRESSVEYLNCGKAIYSRIARICKNDNSANEEYWSTFIKARLNCSMPGKNPFYFDEIKSATYIEREEKIYAVFSTSENSIHGSAICSFTKDSIKKAFDGNFKQQASMESSWESINDRNAKEQFECKHKQVTRDYDPFQVQRKYQLMDESVSPLNGRPMVIDKNEELDRIEIDIIDTKYHKQVEIFFVLTKSNKLRRYVLWPSTTKACLIDEINLNLDIDDKILSTKIYRINKSLYIGTKNEFLRVPLYDCSQYITENDCLKSNDPYCGWDKTKDICSTAPAGILSNWMQRNDKSCANDLTWSSWSDWQECDHEIKNKRKKCFCRFKQCMDFSCTYKDHKIEVTNCTIDGGWTKWSDWSQCSTSCGNGVQTRTRTCSNPSPQYNGRECKGYREERRECNNPICTTTTTSSPEHIIARQYLWSDYGIWEECSHKCGGGMQFRRRRCVKGDCTGCEYDWRTCNLSPCESKQLNSTFTEWSKTYDLKSINDKNEIEITETRKALTCMQENGTELTIKNITEQRVSYSSIDTLIWTDCGTICGHGYQYLWLGNNYIKKSCKVNCKKHIEWSQWSTCMNGYKKRIRLCDTKKSSECLKGKQTEEKPCINNVYELNSNYVNIIDRKTNVIVNEEENAIDSFMSESNQMKLSESKSRSENVINKVNKLSTSYIVLICVMLTLFGSVIGSIMSAIILRRKYYLNNERHERLGLKLFKNNNVSSSSTSNAYVSANDFKTTNKCNNSSVTSSLLIPQTNTLTRNHLNSSSQLNTFPVKEATIKRTSTIRAKINSDFNF